jgi:hypothetical protein
MDAELQPSDHSVGGFPHGRAPAAVRAEQLLDVALGEKAASS